MEWNRVCLSDTAMNEIVSVFNSDRPYETDAHSHDGFMFLVPEDGLMRFNDEVNNWSTTLVQRQFLLVPPDWEHSTAALTGSQSHLVFYVDPDYMRHALRDLSGDVNRQLRLPTMGIWSSSVPLHHLLMTKKALREPSRVIDRRRQLSQTDHLLLLECVAVSLSNPSISRSSIQKHGAALIRDVRAFLDGNLEEAPDLDEIAATFKISRRHLTRLFAEYVGEPIHQYVQRVRIERAKALLRHTRMTILEIAQSVGFQSPSHFAEVFRREHGVAPLHWRRLNGP